MYLGVDLGTSSIKILLSDKNCNIIATAKENYKLMFPYEGWSEQQPKDWIEAFKLCLEKLSKDYNLEDIIGVSFSGQMHGLVILDSEDNIIRPAILWNDNRTTEENDYLNNVIGKEKLVAETGNISYTGFTLGKLLWLKKNERDNFNKISKIMLPKDYLAYVMTGVFATDVSDASGTLYFDVANKCWSKYMLDMVGKPLCSYPQIYESYNVIGKVSLEFAKQTGMSINTNVIIGGGDQAVGAIGTGTVEDNEISISLGTSGVIFSASNSYVNEKDSRLHSFCHANGKYHSMGVELSSASCLDWWMTEILRSKDFNGALDEIANLPIDNLLFLPYLMGERSPINDPNARGAFFGLTLSHSRANMTKAIIEGICFGLYDNLSVMQQLGNISKSAKVVGGGSQSAIFVQILSDILGIEVSLINTNDGGGLGAILLAKSGSENIPVEELCRNYICKTKTFSPDMNKHSQYKEKFDKFKNLYYRTKQ